MEKQGSMVEVWTEQQDPYAMLGLEEGSKSTDADIKKVQTVACGWSAA